MNPIGLEFMHLYFRVDSNLCTRKDHGMQRALFPFLMSDLEEKMVFLGGPRQVGKTTLALSLLFDELLRFLCAAMSHNRRRIQKLPI